MALPGSGPTTYPTPPITFRVTWTTSIVDDTNYYVRVSLDTGSGYTEIGTTTTSATQLEYQHTDFVQNGTYYPVTLSFTFKVEVIKRSDGAVIGTPTTSTVSSVTIGQCNAAQ